MNVNAKVPLLSIENLSLEFRTRSGVVRALERVSLEVFKGETVGVVGESGSGKSVTAYAIMGLLDAAAVVTSGRIVFGGLEVTAASESVLQEVRGREVAMIFQSPRTALNPIRPIGRQIEDVLLRHAPALRRTVRQQALEALARVNIPDPEHRLQAYPFELSGGLCQRVMIALALACKPFLLIADEPTTGLDVTTQAVIMDLIKTLAERHQMSTLLITHDLALAAETCDRIVVMHAGHVVETATTEQLFQSPRHPYTAKLMRAMPGAQTSLAEIEAIPGSLPDLRAALPACRFAERCDRREPQCDVNPLPLTQMDTDHYVACWSPL
jgi:peptide/nickel transport system ATP-binding protein